MKPKDRCVKIHQEEMESIFNLKSLVDHEETAERYAEEYQKLGWVLQAVKPQDDIDLEADAGENPETRVSRLENPGLSGMKISLGVHTGKESRLMVLEVVSGQGEFILDQCGEWRASCTAVLGTGREQHFYAWDPALLFDSASGRGTPGIRWLGAGQVVPVPPSFDDGIQESWQWVYPPWEVPPQCPSQSLARFLRQHLAREPEPRSEVSLSWQEVYCLVSPFKPLLQALSASYPSIWSYYQGILEAAVAAGLKSPEVLLSLLWHAPRGNARQQPEIWSLLQKLVVQGHDQPGKATNPTNVPWEVYLGNFLARASETTQGGTVQAADKPGPPCFLQRSPAKPPQPGGASRTPFSCRKSRADLEKI
jgi:hypothetical protein